MSATPIPPLVLNQPSAGHRDWYAYEALRALPRIILLADHNRYSKAYGSFDRSFWHYRTMDFPCGMNQEMVLPLALAYKYDMPGNSFRGLERLRELALAGIDFADKSSHANGTCDDYFPFERALGALVFSLYAMTETCLELGDKDPRRIAFFAKRGAWLLAHNETGQLANHQAFAALALYNVYMLTGDDKFRIGSDKFRDLTLSWGHEEGWFQEYEGADPGYHACLIAFFAKLFQKSRDASLLEPLKKACDFALWFQHPDGSYAGEYGSRNTFHFYPHGFEVLAPHCESAGLIADTFLHRGMPNHTRHFNDDDRMAAHYVYDWMQAWRDYHSERTGPVELPRDGAQSRYFDDARLLVRREPRYHAVINTSKGGTWKAVSPQGPFAGDTGLIGEFDGGRVAVMHIVDRDSKATVSEDHRTIEVEGVFQERKPLLPTPFKQLVFRVLLLTVGRFNANLVRSLLQKKLIVGKRKLPIRFKRRIEFASDAITVTDTVESNGARFSRLSAGTDATSIYVANSNTFQLSRLVPWTDLDAATVEKLNRDGRVEIVRRIAVPPAP